MEKPHFREWCSPPTRRGIPVMYYWFLKYADSSPFTKRD